MTTTPALPAGEVFPQRILLLDSERSSLIDGTVSYSPHIVVVTDAHHKAAVLQSSPRQITRPFEIAPDHMEELSETFYRLTGRDRSYDMQTLRRFEQQGRSGASEVPFAWASNQVMKCLSANKFNQDDPKHSVALGRMYLFWNAVHSWGHHPKFGKVAAELANNLSFFHTLCHFLIAKSFFEAGNRIGFSTGHVLGEPLTDLYVRVNAEAKEHIEIKAPKYFWWDNWELDVENPNYDQKVRQLIKKKKQISTSRPGHFVIAIEDPRPQTFQKLKQAIENTLQRNGRDRSSLLSIILMQWCGIRITAAHGSGTMGSYFQFEPIENPHSKQA